MDQQQLVDIYNQLPEDIKEQAIQSGFDATIQTWDQLAVEKASTMASMALDVGSRMLGTIISPPLQEKVFEPIKKHVIKPIASTVVPEQYKDMSAKREAQRLSQQAAVEAPKRELALKAAESERASLAPKDNHTIGERLREVIVNKKQKLLEARKKQFNEDNAIVQADVAAKEGNDIFIENSPQTKKLYDDLIQKLRNQLLIGKTAQAQKTAPVSEQGVLSQLDRVYNSIRRQRKEVGIDSNGVPVVKTYPISFNALDDVRRKMGEAAFGKGVGTEGYAGIGEALAKDLYRELSELQAAFSPAKKQLISNYEQASQELNVFKTASGKKASAVEKFDDERFKVDPSALPKTYFTTKQGVKDLLELVDGDINLVEQIGGNYIAQQLEGKTAQQAKAIIKSNEWLSPKDFPVLYNKITGYLTSLEKAEGIPLAEKVIGAAEKQGAQVVGDAEKQAKAILGDKNAVARMADIITGKSSEILQPQVAQYIIQAPGGKEAFTKAVSLALSDSSPQAVKKTFTDNVVPALRKSGLVSDAEIARLSKLVDEIDRTVASAGKEKVNRIVKIVAQAIGGVGAASTSGLTTPLYGGVLSKLSPF
jgi:hypothetical protein